MTTATSTHARWLHISAPIVSNPITGLPDPQRPGATYEPGGLLQSHQPPQPAQAVRR